MVDIFPLLDKLNTRMKGYNENILKRIDKINRSCSKLKLRQQQFSDVPFKPKISRSNENYFSVQNFQKHLIIFEEEKLCF